jgi:regulatory associated protein of mTOR
LLANWNQKSGKLLVGGEHNFIKLWDLSREMSEQEINTGTFSPITSLSSALESDGKLRVASFSDGSVKLFDLRVNSSHESNSQVVRHWSEHKKCVINTHLSKDERFIVSADADCQIKFWDLRSSISFKTFSSNVGDLSCFSVHDFAPIVVCGSKKQKIQLLDTEGNELSVVR